MFELSTLPGEMLSSLRWLLEETDQALMLPVPVRNEQSFGEAHDLIQQRLEKTWAPPSCEATLTAVRAAWREGSPYHLSGAARHLNRLERELDEQREMVRVWWRDFAGRSA